MPWNRRNFLFASAAALAAVLAVPDERSSVPCGSTVIFIYGTSPDRKGLPIRPRA